MEELINKLIEKGWKPFDVDVKIKRAKCFHSVHFIVRWLVNFVLDGYAEATVPLRELCSKESGLWQFVCENRKYGYTIPECWIKNPKICDEGIESVEKECNQNSYEYYIIESALKDESELEEFLLNNIKIDE